MAPHYVTSRSGRRIAEPTPKTIHDVEAAAEERFYCFEGCGEEVGVEDETCACCQDLDEEKAASESRYWDHVNQQIDERLGK